MAVTPTNTGFVLTAKFNGVSSRCDYGWTEKYVLPDNSNIAADAAKARKLVMYRLNTLPEICHCVSASIGLLSTAFKTRMVLTSPTDGAFGAATPSGSPANISIVGPNQTVALTGEEELKIDNPDTCLNFLLQGDGFQHANRLLHGVPDLFVEDFELKGASAVGDWLDAGFTPSGGDPTLETTYIDNLVAFLSALKEFARLVKPNPAFVNDPTAAKWLLATIDNASFRGMSTRKVGRPFSLLAGKAPLGR